MYTVNDRIGIILEMTGMTKTAFAEILKVSQQYISKLVKTGKPSERLIDDICEKIKINGESINRNWLITGVGKPTLKLTRNQEISSFMNDIMELPDADIQKRLIAALAKLDVKEWEAIEKIASSLKLKEEGE